MKGSVSTGGDPGHPSQPTFAARPIETSAGRIQYRYLIIALGSVSNDFGIRGLNTTRIRFRQSLRFLYPAYFEARYNFSSQPLHGLLSSAPFALSSTIGAREETWNAFTSLRVQGHSLRGCDKERVAATTGKQTSIIAFFPP